MPEIDHDLLAKKIVEKQAEQAESGAHLGYCPLSDGEQKTIKDFLRTRKKALKVGGTLFVILAVAAADDIWIMFKSIVHFIGSGLK